jgi:hypothetical protein
MAIWLKSTSPSVHGANPIGCKRRSIDQHPIVILILQLDSGEAPASGVLRPHILMFFCNTSDESPRGRIVANVTL